MVADYATIQVRRKTKRLLEESRRPGETFDAVVLRKLREAEAEAEREFFDELYAMLEDRKSLKPLR